MGDTLKKLQAANPGLNILPITAPELNHYARLLDYDANEMIDRVNAILPTTERVAYEPSVEALEAPCGFNEAMAKEVFGGLAPEVGWCYGSNLQMAALEYHKGIEVDICVTDVIFLFGHVQDIVYGDEITYDTSKVAAFYAPAGSVVEFHCWNLHFAPIHVGEGGSFATVVYLPKGTNEPLTYEVPQTGENRLLLAINKWLIAHPDAGITKGGAYGGMVGDDIFVTPV